MPITIHAPRNHYRQFGALRFILALMVVVSHALYFIGSDANFLNNVGVGNIGVMTFFMLSGFIIAEAGTTFYRDRPFAFLLNRFLRIAPPYWLALAISISTHLILQTFGCLKLPGQAITTSMFSMHNIAANILAIFPLQGKIGLFNLATFYGFVSYYWAILIEVYFYLVAFVVFVASFWLPRFRSQIAVFTVVIFFILHLINEYMHPIRAELSYVPYFIAGVCLFAWRRGSNWAGLAIIPTLVAILLHFARYTNRSVSLNGLFDAEKVVPTAVAVGLIAVMLILIYLLSGRSPTRGCKRLDRSFGDLSYSIYLNHYVILIILASVTTLRTGAVFFALAASVALAHLTTLLIERPMRPLRDTIRNERI